MNTYRGVGARRRHTNDTSTLIPSGAVIVEGTEIALAVADIPAGGTGEVEVCGVHELDAKSADVWDTGDVLYWDAAEEELTDTVGSNKVAGKAHQPKLSLATSALVLVNGRIGQTN